MMLHRASTMGVYLFIAISMGILFVLFPFASNAQQVIIDLNSSSPDDDYLCWSPSKAQARLAQASTSDLTVIVSSQGESGSSGQVHFQLDSGQRPTKQTFSPKMEIALLLKKDGSPISFWVAGSQASKGHKDVSIVAKSQSGSVQGTLPVMVRVRKNAETLSDEERTNFLVAVKVLHNKRKADLRSEYNKYSRSHDQAFELGIHGAPQGIPLFVAWHRAFLLGLERDLQSIDPRVSLPYWRFDQPAPKLFSLEFLGRVQGGSQSGGIYDVAFSPTNPLNNLDMGEGEGPIKRTRNGDTSPPIESTRLKNILEDSQLDFYDAFNGTMELRYHNGAHRGIGGWLASAASPRDPLFYLLHANVDRAWAQWQAKYNKYTLESNDDSAYSAPGSYPGPSVQNRFRKGSYAQDMMWPWNGSEGNQNTPSDVMDDWPPYDFLIQQSKSSQAHTNPIHPIDQLDYMNYRGNSLPLGACYDDLGF